MAVMGMPFGFTVDPDLSDQEPEIEATLRDRLGFEWDVSLYPTGRRGETTNALIARVQRENRRDPFYINSKAMADIKQVVISGLSSLMSSARDLASEQIGQLMIASVQNNVERQANSDRSGFTKLTPGYARRKQAKFGFTTPILKATGDLLGGLRAIVTRRQA